MLTLEVHGLKTPFYREFFVNLSSGFLGINCVLGSEGILNKYYSFLDKLLKSKIKFFCLTLNQSIITLESLLSARFLTYLLLAFISLETNIIPNSPWHLQYLCPCASPSPWERFCQLLFFHQHIPDRQHHRGKMAGGI